MCLVIWLANLFVCATRCTVTDYTNRTSISFIAWHTTVDLKCTGVFEVESCCARNYSRELRPIANIHFHIAPGCALRRSVTSFNMTRHIQTVIFIHRTKVCVFLFTKDIYVPILVTDMFRQDYTLLLLIHFAS